MFIHASRQRWTLPAVVAVALAGCGEADSVKTYEVTRTAPRPQPIDVEQARGELDHMLAAMVPAGDQAWFFKLVARGDQAAAVRKPFDEFVASIDVAGTHGKPQWTLPDGWQEKPGDALRTATIEVPSGGEKLQLTVSSLPLSGEWADYVERNVNRWMGQLQQPPLPAQKVAELIRKSPTRGGAEATVVELVGVMDRATAPGSLPPGHPPVDSAVEGAMPPSGTAAATPADVTAPPAAGSSVAEMPQPKEFTYEAPAGWQPGRYGDMRTAAFNIVEGDKTAEVTVMPFPAAGAMADPMAQAQRWAGQVGLKASEADINAAKTEVTIGGIQGQQFKLLGPAQGVVAAMAAQGDRVWFFKMMGDRSLVESQQEPFEQFLRSIKFTDNAE
ncbi:MAG: hypothetical protein DCC67_12865 [Planctomycetota bacterium]|nr:MAG: hypothetical protein DCC67_12865 [Planctomycetota bacterium]